MTVWFKREEFSDAAPSTSRSQVTPSACSMDRKLKSHRSGDSPRASSPSTEQATTGKEPHARPAHPEISSGGLPSSTRDVDKPERNDMTFVSVASYRDPECQWTIKDAFQKADHPELVRFGVAWQWDAKEDAQFVRVAGKAAGRRLQVRRFCAF